MRTWRTRSGLALTLIAGALAAPAAFGRPALMPRAPLPWRLIDDRDIHVFGDSRLEAELRLALIARATRSIDIVSYAQSADEAVALPLISALRAAAARGVHVRFVTNRLFSSTLDLSDRLFHELVERPSRGPIELILVGDAQPDDSWSITSFAHEKCVIVDGTWVLHGGRMLSDMTLRWLDKSYFITGPLAADSLTVFDRIWAFASRQFVRLESPRPSPGQPEEPPRLFTPPPALQPDARRARALRTELARLDEPAQPAAASAPTLDATDEPPPGKAWARVLHYDFLQQLWMNDFPGSREQRLARLDDPIARALVERIARPDTREVLIGTMIAVFRPEVRQALVDAAHAGKRVHLFVDEARPASGQTPLALNFVLSLPQLAELLAAGVDVETFDLDAEDRSEWLFMHEKLAVIDDTVFFGSHNFSEPSSTNNDEASYEVRDPRFAALLRRIYYRDLRLTATPLALSDVRRRIDGDPMLGLKLWLGNAIEWLF